jgi:hypothetical protein
MPGFGRWSSNINRHRLDNSMSCWKVSTKNHSSHQNRYNHASSEQRPEFLKASPSSCSTVWKQFSALRMGHEVGMLETLRGKLASGNAEGAASVIIVYTRQSWRTQETSYNRVHHDTPSLFRPSMARLKRGGTWETAANFKGDSFHRATSN